MKERIEKQTLEIQSLNELKEKFKEINGLLDKKANLTDI
jgi:hypothetical protein